MTITEYYQHYGTRTGRKYIQYPIDMRVDSAKSFSELYEKCIKEHVARLMKNAIAWHEMLQRYVRLPDAVLWVRRYESSSKKEKALHGGRWPTRRACKTEYSDGFSYVFVSNFDAHEIFNMVGLGVVPDEYEFLRLMKNHQFPLHYDDGGSCEESDIASYPKIGSTRAGVLTVNHWYLAHILSVNDPAYYTEAVDFERLCPRGQLSDWKPHGRYKVRRITQKTLTDHEKDIIRAHFLRFVDPINYYVVPGKNYQDNHGYRFNNNQIGEYAPLNDYISGRFADIYGQRVIEEFRASVFAPKLPVTIPNRSVDISYGPVANGASTVTLPSKKKDTSHAGDDFFGFETFARNNGVKTPSGYSSAIRSIMQQMGIDSLTELETRIDEAVVFCTQKVENAQDQKERRRYSDCRSALKKYKAYLDAFAIYENMECIIDHIL